MRRFSYRKTAILGGVFSGTGISACGFLFNASAVALCLVLTGIGLAMVYTPMFLLLDEYFPDKFVLINSISLFGYTAGSLMLPYIADQSFQAYGYSGAFLILGGLLFNAIVCGVSAIKPIKRTVTRVRRASPQHAQERAEAAEAISDSMCSASSITDERALLILDKASSSKPRDSRVDRVVGEGQHELPSAYLTSDPHEDERGHGGGHAAADHATGQSYQSIAINDVEPTKTTRLLQKPHGVNLHEKKQRDHGESKGGDIPYKAIEHDQRPSMRSSCLQLLRFPCEEPLFILSAPFHFFIGYTIYGWMLFLVPHALQVGIDESLSVSLTSIAGLGGVVGKTTVILLMVFNVDLYLIYIPITVMCTVSFFVDGLGSSFAVRAGLAFAQGFCFFIEDTTPGFFAKETLVHERNFSFALAMTTFLTGGGASVAGLVTGFVYDVTHSYTKAFYFIGCLHAVLALNTTGMLVAVLVQRRKRTGVSNSE